MSWHRHHHFFISDNKSVPPFYVYDESGKELHFNEEFSDAFDKGTILYTSASVRSDYIGQHLPEFFEKLNSTFNIEFFTHKNVSWGLDKETDIDNVLVFNQEQQLKKVKSINKFLNAVSAELDIDHITREIEESEKKLSEILKQHTPFDELEFKSAFFGYGEFDSPPAFYRFFMWVRCLFEYACKSDKYVTYKTWCE